MEKRGNNERLLAAVCQDGTCSSLGKKRESREMCENDRRKEGEGRGVEGRGRGKG
jgi:hypothetical protein